jgi:hypothetical protein
MREEKKKPGLQSASWLHAISTPVRQPSSRMWITVS